MFPCLLRLSVPQLVSSPSLKCLEAKPKLGVVFPNSGVVKSRTIVSIMRMRKDHHSIYLQFRLSLCGVLVFGCALPAASVVRLPPSTHTHTQLSHTQLTHTQLSLSHTTCSHTTLSHTQLTHTEISHNLLTHTQLSHTQTHTHTTYPQNHTTYSHTHTTLSQHEFTHKTY